MSGTARARPLATDELTFNEAIRALHAYSLVRRDLPGKTLSVHRLVQAVLRDAMNEETQRLWAERTVRAVAAAFPADDSGSVEVANWSRCEQLLPHVQSCLELLDRYGLSFPEAARLLNQVGGYLNSRDQNAGTHARAHFYATQVKTAPNLTDSPRQMPYCGR